MTTANPDISVCIVTRNRHEHLGECLRDLASQQHAPRWELLVAADDDPATEAVVRRFVPTASVLHTMGLTLGANRNRLADKATGALTLYLDDDVRLPATLLADLATITQDYPDIDVFGGPNLTPPDAPAFEQTQGRLLANPLLTGPAALRYRALTKPRRSRGAGLTLCNLAIRTRTAARFPENQHGGEELTLLAELRRNGNRMLRHPGMTVHHQRRPSPREFAQQMFKYGYGRGEAFATTWLGSPHLRNAASSTKLRAISEERPFWQRDGEMVSTAGLFHWNYIRGVLAGFSANQIW